jgi:DNA-binding NarL/FixJ family response regulator
MDDSRSNSADDSLPRPPDSAETQQIQISVPRLGENSPRVIVVIANESPSTHVGAMGLDSALASLPGFDDLMRLALKPSIDALSSLIADVVRQQLAATQMGPGAESHSHGFSPKNYVPPSSGNAVPHRSIGDLGFSKRELEVLRHLVDGCSNKAIARKMYIAETTVKIYVRRILNKTQSTNRTQAVLWAIDQLERTKDAAS